MNIRKMSKPKMYAVSLGICSILIAVLALVATNIRASEVKNDITTTQTIVSTTVGNVNSDEVKEPYNTTARHPETTTAPVILSENTKIFYETTSDSYTPISYVLPLSTDIGKDYSQGIPVYSEILSDWRTHDGVDFNGAYGDCVKAIASGIVTDIYEDELYGTVEVIDHGGGIKAYYCGMNKKTVLSVGDKVESAQKVGELGIVPCENDSEYPHLHFEIKVSGEISDPIEVMGYYQ